MAVKLNHTLVDSRDRDSSALFLSEMLGIDPPLVLGPFALVKVGDELTLDFRNVEHEIKPQHYAFLVSEPEFDEIFARIEKHQLDFWADPHKHPARDQSLGRRPRRLFRGSQWPPARSDHAFV